MNKDSFCRLCAKNTNDSSLISINDPISRNLNLSSKIQHCFRIKIEENDILSKKICPKCCGHVVFTYNLYESIQKAQEILKASILETGNYNILSEIDRQDLPKLDPYQELNSDDNDFVDTLFADSDSTKPGIKNEETQTEEIEPIEKKEQVVSKRRPRKILFKSKTEKLKVRKRKIAKRKSEDTSSNSDGELIDTEIDDDICKEFPDLFILETKDDKSIVLSPLIDGWEKYQWKCTPCHIELTSVTELRNHFNTVHCQSPVYRCMDCKKAPYSVYHGFLAHVRIHRPHLKYCCDVCCKFFRRKKLMESHRLRHIEMRPHVCLRCNKRFRTKHTLLLHSKTHLPNDEKNVYPCDICSKKFAIKQNLLAHQRIHAGIKEHTCEQCGKSFVQKGNLEHHIITHTAVKPYTCAICAKTFKTLVRLKRHETVHSGLKPHQCDICGRQFREKATLTEHHRIHTGAMPFTCEFCGKSFRFKGILTTHRRQHTGERPYSCHQCQHHFTNWPNYNKHMKRRHGINTSVSVRQPQTIPPTGMPCRNPPGTVIVPTVHNAESTTAATVDPVNLISTNHGINLQLNQQLSAVPQMIFIQNNPNTLSTNINQNTSSPTCVGINTATLMNLLGMNVSLNNGISASSPIIDNAQFSDKTGFINTALVDTTNGTILMPNLLNLYNVQPC